MVPLIRHANFCGCQQLHQTHATIAQQLKFIVRLQSGEAHLPVALTGAIKSQAQLCYELRWQCKAD